MNIEIGPSLKEFLMSKAFHDDLAGLGTIIFFIIIAKIIGKVIITVHKNEQT